MIDKLQAIEEHYKQLEERLSDPATLADMKLFAKLNKEYKDLGHIVRAFHEYKNITSNIQSAKDIIFQVKGRGIKGHGQGRTGVPNPKANSSRGQAKDAACA